MGVATDAGAAKKPRRKRGGGGGKKAAGDAPAPAAAAAAGKPKKVTGIAAKALAAKEARRAAEAAKAAEEEAARAAAAEAAAAEKKEAEERAARNAASKARKAAAKKGRGKGMSKAARAKLEAQRARLGISTDAGTSGAALATRQSKAAKHTETPVVDDKAAFAGPASAAAPEEAVSAPAPKAPGKTAKHSTKTAADVIAEAAAIHADSVGWEDLLGDDTGDKTIGDKTMVGAIATGFEGDWDAADGDEADALGGLVDEDGVAVDTGAGALTDEELWAAVAAKQGAAIADEQLGYSEEECMERSKARRAERKAAAKALRSKDRLRSPICCVMGHVDTGKTKLLDQIRRTNVQGGEAGGITQQIGATYFPIDRLRRSTDKLAEAGGLSALEYKIPGLLVIDTPGHESFTNLRSRGSSLCDIAVLVIDIMHGLEPQTIESLNLLRRGKTPFIVALNKVDRLYGWKSEPNRPIRDSLAAQPANTVDEFETRTQAALTALAEQGLNAKLYYENDSPKKVVSVVPTSAHTGEGVPDLLSVLVRLTQQLMAAKLSFVPFPVATVLEVKGIDGLGTTIDIVLVNGELSVGDEIVVCGMKGPIVTKVRALLTPPPAKEIRVKADYVHHKHIVGAMGVKIAAPGLADAVAGTQLLVKHKDDYVLHLEEEVQADLEAITQGFNKQATGLFVQASTLGSLEALLEYLKGQEPPIPIAGVNLGPIHKRHVMEASTMLDREDPRFAVMLAFDVPTTPDAAAYAEAAGVRIFSADIIYHLTDMFEKYMEAERAKRQAAAAAVAVFPARLSIVPTAIFNKKNPIVLGCTVKEGRLRIGTPLCAVTGRSERGDPVIVELGRVTSIQHNHEEKEVSKAGDPDVAVKIEPSDDQRHIMFGRHFDASHELVSRITRESIDALKAEFRSDVKRDEWMLLVDIKKQLGVL